ncbi:hypothetical protein M23134_03679 [Microscilla marina ATCC 23134]|uniref:Uncharacterized protein n=1 Tax=Microscilla marina ATCC 23134 TaxID=313606 RepID=A1ZX91_MICM2|nr:hypothetical protein M23134_03679 [Microscilla marina ATCC 23134]
MPNKSKKLSIILLFQENVNIFIFSKALHLHTTSMPWAYQTPVG